MNCLIVDDNAIARTTLRQLAGQVKDLTVAGECAGTYAVGKSGNFYPCRESNL